MVRTNRKICRLLSHNVRLTFTVCRQFVHRCVITCSFRPISNSETVICLYIINSHLLFDCTMISLHFLCLHRTLRTLVREELGCHSVAAWLFECSRIKWHFLLQLDSLESLATDFIFYPRKKVALQMLMWLNCCLEVFAYSVISVC